MLKLYGGARSRASIVRWYLEELGAEYEFVCLDMQNGEHQQPEFLAINPIGKVPAITDGTFKLWESGAILLYLAEKHGQLPTSLEEKATIYQWILFANSSLSMGLMTQDNRNQAMQRFLKPIDEILQHSTFILGNEFSVVDVALGSILAYIPLMFKDIDLAPFPSITKYIQDLGQRPAFQKTIMSPAT